MGAVMSSLSFWVIVFLFTLALGLHNMFLTHRFGIRASGISPILQKNIYDIVLMSWGATLFVAGHASFIALGFVLLVAMTHCFYIKKLLSVGVRKVPVAAALLSISAAKFSVALRMRIYDTAMIAWGAICVYASMTIHGLYG